MPCLYFIMTRKVAKVSENLDWIELLLNDALVWFLPFLGMDGMSSKLVNLNFEEITTGIIHAELLAIKATGLALVIMLCIRHLKHAGKDGDKEK